MTTARTYFEDGRHLGRAVALLAGHHRRCGATSPLAALPCFVLQLVLEAFDSYEEVYIAVCRLQVRVTRLLYTQETVYDFCWWGNNVVRRISG